MININNEKKSKEIILTFGNKLYQTFCQIITKAELN